MKFDGRVIGIPTHLNLARQHLSRPDFAIETAKFNAARDKLIAKLPAERKAITDLFNRRHDCVGHFRSDRVTLLQPLQDFACFVDGTSTEEVVEENAWTGSLHLVMIGQHDALGVPFDFGVPYEAPVEGRAHKYYIVSTPRLLKELAVLNEYLAAEHTFKIDRFPDFMNASKQAMDRFESDQGIGKRFWAKFALVALRGLVEHSIKDGLPLLIDPQFGSVPVETA